MPRCTASSHKTGQQCKKSAIRGATVCEYHGAGAPQVRAKAAVVAELQHWGLRDETLDPAETLLRLMTQSVMRAELYAGLLQQAYDAAERLRDSEITGAGLDDDSIRDLREALSRGGVAALVGKTYAAAGKDGDVFVTGEAIRGLAQLEATERDRAANFAAKAVAAGLAERQVRIAERQAEMAFGALRAALEDCGLGDRVSEVLGHAGRHLRLIAG